MLRFLDSDSPDSFWKNERTIWCRDASVLTGVLKLTNEVTLSEFLRERDCK